MDRTTLRRRTLRCIGAFWLLAAGTLSASAHGQTLFEDVANQPLGSGQNWTNYIRLADLDGDSDLDVLIPSCGGFFANPAAQPFLLYRNNGAGSFTDATSAMLGSSPNLAARVVAVGDVDGDGDLDIFIPSASGENDRLYINASGVFTDEAATRLPVNAQASNSAAARFADLDGDGSLDLLVGQGYVANDSPPVRLLVNDGNGVFADRTMDLPQAMVGVDPDDIDVLDIDRDFDLDIFVNAHTGKSALWENDGSGKFSDRTASVTGPSTGLHYGPAACDVDGDGDLDLWIDNLGPGYTEQLLINDGSGNYADETAQRVSGNPGSDDNGVVCVDVDNDGDMDAVVASLSGNERVLENDGAGKFQLRAGAFTTIGDPTLWLDFGDLNNDGRMDAVSAQGEGSPALNRVYLGTANQVIDTLAPKIIGVEPVPMVSANASFDVRYAVQDRTVGDSGPRLKAAYATVTIDGGNAERVEAVFVGGDLFQVTIPGVASGSVEVDVCAEDTQANVGCSGFQYVVGGGAGSGGGGGTGGQDNAAAAGPGAGTGGAGGGFSLDDTVDGCSCSAARPSTGWGLWALVALAGLATARRAKFGERGSLSDGRGRGGCGREQR